MVFSFLITINGVKKMAICLIPSLLSSPRAKGAGPKGLRAESARAVTGRQNSYSGRGEDFFYGNSCNSGTESRKIVPNVGN